MKNKKYILISTFLLLFLYTIWQSFFSSPFGAIKGAVWDYQHKDTDQTTVEILSNSSGYEEDMREFEKYLELDKMNFSRVEKDEDYLLILGENYSRSYYNEEEGIYTKGPMGFYNGAVIVMVEKKKGKVVKEIELSSSDGKVIYMDQNQYGVMKHEKVIFYEISTGEIIKGEIIDNFKNNKTYYVESECNKDEVKIYYENPYEIMKIIKIPIVK